MVCGGEVFFRKSKEATGIGNCLQEICFNECCGFATPL